MWTETPLRPDVVIIKTGIVDDGGLEKFTPVTETFLSRKPAWVKTLDGTKQFQEAFPFHSQK